MISVSNEFKMYSADPLRQTQVKVMVSDGEEWLEFGKDKIVSLEIDQSISDGGEYSLGVVIPSKLSLSLYTSETIEKNAVVNVFIRYLLGGDESEWVQLGRYKIDTRKKQGSVWNFECYDELMYTQKLYDSNLFLPFSLKQMLLEIGLMLKIEYEDGLLDSLPDYPVSKRLENNLYTIREVLSYAAQIYACNVVVNNEGKLKFISSLDRTKRHTISASEYSNYNVINNPKVFSKIVVNQEGSDYPLDIGEGDTDNTVFLFNPIMTEPMLEYTLTQIEGFTYDSVSVNNWRFVPYIECGDFVEVVHRDGTKVTTVIQTLTLTYSGGSLIGKFTSPVKSSTQSEYGFSGSTSQAIGTIQKRIGVYVLRENPSKLIVNTNFQAKMMLPLTSMGTTDLEFTLYFSGTSSTDTFLHSEIRAGTMILGKTAVVKIHEGMNTFSISYLVTKAEAMSENLLLFLKTEGGRFEIEKGQAQFYVYGANLVGSSGVPYASAEDTIEYEDYMERDVVVTTTQIPSRINVIDTIEFKSYVNSDSVDIEII